MIDTRHVVHVTGKDKGRILLFALSTCGWCRKTKNLLQEMGVDFSYVDVDVLDEGEKEKVMEEVRAFNPRCSFPTLVVNDRVIVGFDDSTIREAVQ